MCKAIAKSVLVFFDGLMLLVGLGIAAISAYLISEQKQHKIFGDDPVLEWALWVPFGIGLFVALVAAIACCVSIAENKCCIGFFGCMQIFFAFIVGITGVFLLVYDKYAKETAYTPVNSLDEGIGNSIHLFYDFQLGIFDTCCGMIIPAPLVCPAEFNSEFAYCLFNETSSAFEAGQQSSEDFCDALNNPDQLDWCHGHSGASTLSPTLSPTASPTKSPTVSPTMAPTEFDPNATLAPTSSMINETEAPTTSPPAPLPPIYLMTGSRIHGFQVAMYEYSHPFVFGGGIAFLVFAFVLGMASCLSCCLACSRSNEKYEKVHEPSQQRSTGASSSTATSEPIDGQAEASEKDTLTMA